MAGCPISGGFPDQCAGALRISHLRLDVSSHAQRHHLARRISGSARLTDRGRMMFDAGFYVPGPLRHLAGDVGEPTLAAARPGGFDRNTPRHEIGRLGLIALVVEGVTGGTGIEHRRLFELVGAGPGHDPLIPAAGFRSPVRVVEQEQGCCEFRRQFQIARDGPLERGAQIGHLVIDRVRGLGFIDACDLLAELPASRRIDLAMPGFDGLQRTAWSSFSRPKACTVCSIRTADGRRCSRASSEVSTSSSIPPQHLGLVVDVARRRRRAPALHGRGRRTPTGAAGPDGCWDRAARRTIPGFAAAFAGGRPRRRKILACRSSGLVTPLSMFARLCRRSCAGRDLDGERNAIEIGANPLNGPQIHPRVG